MLPFTAQEIKKLFVGSEIPLCMLLSMHCATHLRATYRLFPGDLLSALLFDQIVAHAAAGSLEPNFFLNEAYYAMDEGWATRATNVNSLALSTGVPRETVRRKVQALVDQGWITMDEAGLIRLARLTPGSLSALDSFAEVLVSFIQTARKLEALLDRKLSAELAERTSP